MAVPPEGQPATGCVPFTFSRTAAVQPGLQPRLTIAIDGTSVLSDGAPNVSVKPVLPAPAAVTVPAKPGIALTAAATFPLLIARPPFPSTAELLPPIWIWNELLALPALKPVSVTCCCSLPPWSAAAMPATVLF